MVKRKQKASKKGSRHKDEDSLFDDLLPAFFDRRAIEGVMQKAFSDLGSGKGHSPLDKAQEIIYQAYETPSEARRIALANKALKICPDCADAFVLLAEHATTLEEAMKHYTDGVAAGERALGKEGFEEYAGEFWGFLETRPYMRARQGLAQCLREANCPEEAAAHYRDMLRLNPNDNQGIRYELASLLLDLDQDAELKKLLDQYKKDASAEWCYTRALLTFRKQGDSEQAVKALQKAKKANKYVPAYIAGNKPLPRQLPEFVGWGDENEAIDYVAASLSAWRNTSGAIPWLRKSLKVPLFRTSVGRKISWSKFKSALLKLPQDPGEVWQVDARPLLTDVEIDKEQINLWGMLITNQTNDSVVKFEFGYSRPLAGDVWEYLLEAMRNPQECEAHRPGQIQVCNPAFIKSWGPKLKQIGIECLHCSQLEHFEEVLTRISPSSEYAQRLKELESQEFLADESELLELPQHSGEVWQADVRILQTWLEVDNAPQRPWMAVVSSLSEDIVLAHDLMIEKPPADWLWRNVHRAMRQPMMGDPHRPGIIQVNSEEYRQTLLPHLAAADIRCVAVEKLEQLDRLLELLARQMEPSRGIKAIMDSPGVTPEQVNNFFAAAAEFYRRAPWRQIPGDVPIKIECDKYQSSPWYAVVMGQSGMTVGLALYDDLEAIVRTFSGELSPEENMRRTSGLSVTFGEEFEIAVADLAAAEKYGWPIAGPQAYPCAMRINPGLALRAPLIWELELLEGCLRALPDFIAAKNARLSKMAPVTSGELSLRMSIVEGV